jgi:hypothetical protein
VIVLSDPDHENFKQNWVMHLYIVDFSASAVRNGDAPKMWSMQRGVGILVPAAESVCRGCSDIVPPLQSTSHQLLSTFIVRCLFTITAHSLHFVHNSVCYLCISPLVFLPCSVQPLPEPVCVCACVRARACVCICC